MASLLILHGAKAGQQLVLRPDRTILGREQGCDVVIEKSMLALTGRDQIGNISRKHGLISRVGDQYYLEDGDGLGNKSRNGIKLNDNDVPYPGRVLLRNNDRISICGFHCTFLDETGQPSLPGQEGKSPGGDRGADPDNFTSLIQSSIPCLEKSQVSGPQPAEKLQILLDISNSLSTNVELDSLLPRIVDKLFQLFTQAERGLIFLWDKASDSITPWVFKTRGTSCTEDAHYSTSVVRQCVNNREAILANDVLQCFARNSSIISLPIRCLMCAPLLGQDGKAVGAIQLDTQNPRMKFSQDDLNLLLAVAGQASRALCNVRLYQDYLANKKRQRELEVACQIQRAFLPQRLPDVPGYEFFASYESAEQVGGDCYDFIPLPQQRLCIMLGDVVGKGIAAALIMVKFGGEVRYSLQKETGLTAAMANLNSAISATCPEGKFVTTVALSLDPEKHLLEVVNAGHPSPLLFHRDTGRVEELVPPEAAGFPIGFLEKQTYTARLASLEPGDVVLLFSDGVYEAEDVQGQQFGLERLQGLLQKPFSSSREVGDNLLRAVKQHAVGRPQYDDMTLICFGRTLA